jgi:hypothetical protein
VQHLEEAGEAVAEDLAGEEEIEGEEREPAGEECQRDAGPAERGRVPLEEPGGARDDQAEDDVADGAEEADDSGQQDQAGVLPLARLDQVAEARQCTCSGPATGP